jgi:hypothetical protein
MQTCSTVEIAFNANMPERSQGKLVVFAIKETAMMLIQRLPHTFSTLLARLRSPRGLAIHDHASQHITDIPASGSSVR